MEHMEGSFRAQGRRAFVSLLGPPFFPLGLGEPSTPSILPHPPYPQLNKKRAPSVSSSVRGEFDFFEKDFFSLFSLCLDAEVAADGRAERAGVDDEVVAP